MRYEEEGLKLKEWYLDENRKIYKEMDANPVPGLDHPLQAELAKVQFIRNG